MMVFKLILKIAGFVIFIFMFTACKVSVNREKTKWKDIKGNKRYKGEFELSEKIDCELVYITDGAYIKIPKKKHGSYPMLIDGDPFCLQPDKKWKISPSHRYILYIKDFINHISKDKGPLTFEAFYQRNSILKVYDLKKHNSRKILMFQEKELNEGWNIKRYRRAVWSPDEKGIYVEVFMHYYTKSSNFKRIGNTMIIYVDLNTLKTYKLWETGEFITKCYGESTINFYSMDINHPIGDKIIFYGYDEGMPKRGIIIFDIKKREMKKFPGIANPIIHPTGKYISFGGLWGGKRAIFLMDLSNYKYKLLYENKEGHVFAEAWAPDGKFLAVSEVNHDGDSYVSVVSKDGKLINRVFSYEDYRSKPTLVSASFSKDGRFLLADLTKIGKYHNVGLDLIIDFYEKKFYTTDHRCADCSKKLAFIENHEISRSLKRRYWEIQKDEKQDPEKLKFIIWSNHITSKRKKKSAVISLWKFLKAENKKRKSNKKFRDIFKYGLSDGGGREDKQWVFRGIYDINCKETFELLKEIKDFYGVTDEEISKYPENDYELPRSVRNLFKRTYKYFQKKYSKGK